MFFCKLTLFAVLFVLQILPITTLFARNNCPDQGPRLSADDYCRLYAAEAQKQMRLYGIPASITLAQGMYESGYGSSYLAVRGNNHFGIKAYHGWSGAVIRCDDDASNEPFCKFKTVQEGYEYHSRFLKDNTRYAPLFKLSPSDFNGWAKGLQKCGYATNPQYPNQLIDIIERYQLDKYDKLPSAAVVGKPQSGYVSNKTNVRHKLYRTSARHGLKYVRANKADQLEYIAAEFKVKTRQLRKWNDMPKHYSLREGELVYLQAKRSKSDKEHPTHTVASGESLLSISQLYGVTVSSIIKRNHLTSATVRRGQVLKLR